MWKNIDINSNLIEASNGFSTLIKCPNNSAYKGYMFWITNKCVHEGRNSASVNIGYTEEFKFRLIKYGKGRYNKNEKIDEIEINSAQFEELFGIINDNVKENKQIYKFQETHRPDKVEAVENNLINDLVDEEE